MAGTRFCAASVTMSSRCTVKNWSVITTRPPSGSWPSADMAASMSEAERTGAEIGVTPKERAAPSNECKKCEPVAVLGLNIISGSFQSRRKFPERFQPLATDRPFEVGKAGDISTWPGQACDKAVVHRVGNQHEHDRCRAGLPQQRLNPGSTGSDDDFRARLDKIFRKFLHSFNVPGRPTVVDADIAAIDPAEVLKRLFKCCDTGPRLGVTHCHSHQNADLAHSAGLLRGRGERPRRRAAEKRRLMQTPRTSDA